VRVRQAPWLAAPGRLVARPPVLVLRQAPPPHRGRGEVVGSEQRIDALGHRRIAALQHRHELPGGHVRAAELPALLQGPEVAPSWDTEVTEPQPAPRPRLAQAGRRAPERGDVAVARRAGGGRRRARGRRGELHGDGLRMRPAAGGPAAVHVQRVAARAAQAPLEHLCRGTGGGAARGRAWSRGLYCGGVWSVSRARVAHRLIAQ